LARIGLFEEVFCHNPNFATCWRYVLTMPWHKGKKQKTKYSQFGWRVVVTRAPDRGTIFGDLINDRKGVKLLVEE